MQRTLAGIFVGGNSSRMGGRPKGLLEVGGETIVARWKRIFASLEVPVVLVGEHDAYASSGLAIVPDLDGADGPLGGVEALCTHARAEGATYVIAVACDMPHVSPALVRRLLEAPPANAIAPRIDGKWQPFFARYDAAFGADCALGCALLGHSSLQDFLDVARTTELVLSEAEARELRDWDTPEDVDQA